MGKVARLPVGQIGTTLLDIPVYTLGTGKPPVFGITCYVHGNEAAGAFIVSRFIDLLQLSDTLHGTIHIIPVANPAAQLVNYRVSPLDLQDLNRLGSGRSDGSFTERIGAGLFEFLAQCDVVVNIHEFEMLTPITAVFMNAGRTEEIKVEILKALRAFSPDIIWAISPLQSSDVQYQTSLDTALIEAGVVEFPIETAQLAHLTDAEIDRAAQGLLQVAAHLGIAQPLSENSDLPLPAPAFIRQEVRANDAGLWEPSGKLMQSVGVGDLIGTIRTIPEFQTQFIYSPASGVLVQQRHREVVATGTSLFSIGHDADGIIVPYI